MISAEKSNDGELISILKQLEELNERLHKTVIATGEAMYRILPDESVSEKKAPDAQKQLNGHIGALKSQIYLLAESVDRANYNLSRIERIG